MSDKKKQKPAKITIDSVYIEYQPLSANTPSVGQPIGLGDEPTFTRNEFMKVLRKASRPDAEDNEG